MLLSFRRISIKVASWSIQQCCSLPSLELSQKQELAVCSPAPFFCIITQVTVSRKAFINVLLSLIFSYIYAHYSTCIYIHTQTDMHAYKHLKDTVPAQLSFVKFHQCVTVPALSENRKLSSPIYLKGFPSLVSWLRDCSTTLVVHWFTLLCW